MHSLLFLDPGHFHAALTLRVPQARAADEVFVYAHEGAELRNFLALVERFNRRAPNPTRWRPVVTTTDDPLGRLVEERRGDVVVLAGRNGGKARTIRRLHESGFHVLADKPWLVEPADLAHVRASLEGWPLAAEIMTGRHDVAARLVKRLVGVPALFGTGGPPYVMYLAGWIADPDAQRATISQMVILNVGLRVLAFTLAGRSSRAPASGARHGGAHHRRHAVHRRRGAGGAKLSRRGRRWRSSSPRPRRAARTWRACARRPQ